MKTKKGQRTVVHEQQPQESGPLKEDEQQAEQPKLQEQQQAKQFSTSVPPVFVRNSNDLVLCADKELSVVRVLSAKAAAKSKKSGEGEVARFNTPQRVVALARCPVSSNLVYTAHTDNTVCEWDLDSRAAPLRKWSLGAKNPIRGLHFSVVTEPNSKNAVHCYTDIEACEGSPSLLVELDLSYRTESEDDDAGQKGYAKLAKMRNSTHVAVSGTEGVAAFITKTQFHSARCWPKVCSWNKYAIPEPANSLHASPVDPLVFATCHSSGRLHVWNLDRAGSVIAVRQAHWHAYGVNAAYFLPNGLNILSGGPDAVLVTWPLDTLTKPRFLPRLGAGICSISSSDSCEMYALVHADNTLRFVNGVNNSLVASVAGIRSATAIATSSRSTELKKKQKEASKPQKGISGDDGDSATGDLCSSSKDAGTGAQGENFDDALDDDDDFNTSNEEKRKKRVPFSSGLSEDELSDDDSNQDDEFIYSNDGSEASSTFPLEFGTEGAYGGSPSNLKAIKRVQKGLPETALAVDPTTGFIIVEGHPGTLQFYNSETDCIEFEHLVVPYVHAPDIPAPRITHLDVCSDWLVTVDTRVSNTCNLRVWERARTLKEQKFIASMRVPELPQVTAVQFCETESGSVFLAVARADGEINVFECNTNNKLAVSCAWPARPDTHEVSAASAWTTKETITFRSLVPRACAWSADGSLLCASFGTFVTLWGTESSSIVNRGSFVVDFEATNVSFGDLVAPSPQLIAAGAEGMCIIDLLTMSLSWHQSFCDLGPLCFAASQTHFAVGRRGRKELTVFKVSPCNYPAVELRATCSGGLSACTFTTTNDIVLIARNDGRPRILKHNVQASAKSPLTFADQSLATSLVVPQKQSKPAFAPAPGDSGHGIATLPGLQAAQAAAAVFDSPCHLQPPIETLFDRVMATLLQ